MHRGSWRAGLSAIAIVVSVGAGASACGSSGREIRPVPGGATAAPRSTSTTSAIAPASPATQPRDFLSVVSPAFDVGAKLPDRFVCPSTTSPPLIWGKGPRGTVELALMAVDTLDGKLLWIVTGIPAATEAVFEGQRPPGSTEQPNSFGFAGYSAPCPSDGAHLISFEVMAFDKHQELAAGATPEDVRDQLTRDATKSAVLTATAG